MAPIVLSAAITAALLGRVLVGLGPRLGYVDNPDDPSLKRHRRSAVPLGGVAVLAAALVGWWVGGALDGWLIVLATAVLTLGLVDDRVGLSPVGRLVAELVLAAATVLTGVLPSVYSEPLGAILATAVIVVAINAVNLFDGLDALVGSTALVSFAVLALLVSQTGGEPAFSLAAAGAVAGFLVWNSPPARMFLGDNGAYLVGYLLAVSVLRLSPEGFGAQLIGAGLALGVYLFDFAATVLRRRMSGRPMFAGDRNHLYDRLHDGGLGVGWVAVLASIAQAAFAGIGLWVYSVGQTMLGAAVAVSLAIVALLTARGIATVAR